MAIFQGAIGSIFGRTNPGNTGTNPNVRQGFDASLVTMDAHGRYQEAVQRGSVYVASNQAAQALSTALSTTQTGFTLTNPAGSNVNLVVLDAVIALATAPAGISDLVWAANVNTVATAVTQTTALTVRNALLGSSLTGAGLAASAVTLPAAPVVVRPVGGGPVATGSVTSPFIRDEIAGLLVLTPGTALSLSCLTTAISVLAAVTWEEVTTSA
jgi:hypothetical protein